jgi:flagellin-like hook-associated protein FlgL|tara:strand:- start:154 stop:327 length:174 start_codon:yes stop_codon:yes gene_type:complete
VLKVEHDHRYRGMVLQDDGEKARKMAEITKEQIILEGGKSVLVQADQKPQTVMSLLK